MTRFMVFDRFGTYLRELTQVTAAKRVRKTDGTNSLAVTSLVEVEKGNRIVFSDNNGVFHEYIVTQPSVERSGSVPVYSFNATDSIKELDLKYVDDKRINGGTWLEALQKAIDGTRWEAGNVATGTVTTNYYHISALKALQTFLSKAGTEFATRVELSADKNSIAHRYIDIGTLGGQTSKRFQYGSDLTSIKRTVSADNVYTRLYGYGKGLASTDAEGNETGGYGRKIDFADVNDGKPYVQDDEALNLWGVVGPDGTKVHAEGVVDFPDCEDKNELLALTKAALAQSAQPKVSYTADVAALRSASFDVLNINLGDSVQIVDTSFTPTLRLSGRVTGIEDDPTGDINSMKLTLGNLFQSYTQQQRATQDTVSQLVSSSSSITSAAGITPQYVQGIIDGINTNMNVLGGNTYLTSGEGIISYNKPLGEDPTEAVRMSNGLVQASSAKSSTGEWQWITVSDGKGIPATAITSGTLTGIPYRSAASGARLELEQTAQGGGMYFKNDSGVVTAAVKAVTGGLILQAGIMQLNDVNAAGGFSMFSVDGATETNGVSPDSDGAFPVTPRDSKGATVAAVSSGRATVLVDGWYEVNALVQARRTGGNNNAIFSYASSNTSTIPLGPYKLSLKPETPNTWVEAYMPTMQLYLNAGDTVYVTSNNSDYEFGPDTCLWLFRHPFGNL